MPNKELSTGLRALAILILILLATGAWAATSWKEKMLLFFNTQGPNQSHAGLVFDAAGNLYGTSYSNGAYGYGTVFELTPTSGGNWTETILHTFNQDGTDGYMPIAGLIRDAAGNLYGTTGGGGTYNDGTVFELTPTGGGSWTETVLHSFNRTDGYYPTASLIFDTAGNLYGTTVGGGTNCINEGGCGTVFELTPTAGGGWMEKVLHSFGDGADGQFPGAALISDAAGNLYGTTQFGGSLNCPGNPGAGCGIVFELTPSAGGSWTEKVLHNFQSDGTDGWDLFAGLTWDAAGDLYGATYEGGVYGGGIAFELTPSGGGTWTEKVLHSFNPFCSQGHCPDGYAPVAGLLLDTAGNLYGTTFYGGACAYGTVFKLTPTSGGNWTETILLTCTDAGDPTSNLIFDHAGNLFGMTAWANGPAGYGTVFELRPTPCTRCTTADLP